jgi:hypothetical protein
MFEVVLVIATCGVMARIAIADERSSILWGLVTLVICIASFGIPVPYLRILLAFIASFIIMMVAKARFGI